MEQPKMEVLNPKNEAHCECFRRMMHAYAAELGGMEEFAGKQGIDAFVEKVDRQYSASAWPSRSAFGTLLVG